MSEHVSSAIVPRSRKSRARYRVAVIGSGSWATAIVKIISVNLEHIHWWVRQEEVAESIVKYGHNPKYLSSVFLNPEDLKVSTDIKSTVARADYVIIVTPSAYLHKTLEPLKRSQLSKKKIILAVKGIVPETMQLISDYMQSQFKVPIEQLCIISGPSHAEEIAQEKFTFLTAASTNTELAETVAKFFTTRYCRTSVSNDVMGAELSIVLKNIYALGAGIYSGLGYGDNFIAAYVANCLKEMKYFVSEVYPNDNRHISDSVYLGDLLVTAYSTFSRNRLFGIMIGHGLSVRVSLLELRMVSEGYTACRCVHEINKKIGANIPIVETIYGILYENNNVSSEMKRIAEHFV